MPAFGLDIGLQTIKAIQLEKRGENYAILAAGITPTPLGGFDSDLEKDLIPVADAIKKLITDSKIALKQAAISLPEHLVFTRLVQLPYLTDEEVASAISWQAEPYIPIPITEASIDYQIVGRQEPKGNFTGKVEVLLVAAPKSVISRYVKVAELAGIEVVEVETELLALARSITPLGQTVLLADLGATSTDLAIVKNNQLVVSRSVPTGGNVLTKSVSSSLALTVEQAEEYKKTYGLKNDQLEGKVKFAIEPAFKLIIDEMKKIIQYYKSEMGAEDQINVAVIAGGGANMSDITSVLAQNLGIEVIVGDPFNKVIKDENTAKKLAVWAPLYGVAVGLAQNI